MAPCRIGCVQHCRCRAPTIRIPTQQAHHQTTQAHLSPKPLAIFCDGAMYSLSA